jgi:hypothetical protein
MDFNDVYPERKNYVDLYGPGPVPGYLDGGDITLGIPLLCGKLPKQGTIVEVGSFLGKSATQWAKNLKMMGKDYKIICIDNFSSKKEILHDLMQCAKFAIPNKDYSHMELFRHYTSAYPNIKPVRACFNDRFAFPAKVELVFEDSTHEQGYLSYALPFWWDKIVPGGILAGHDYWFDEVESSVELFAALHDVEVKTFDQDKDNCSIWYIEKK